MEFRASGDTGLTVILGDNISPETTARVLNLRTAIETAEFAGVIEVVPTYLSLLVHYDPLETSQATLKEAIVALGNAESSRIRREVASWSFPVCFELAEFAPDLESVASHANLSPADLIEAITNTQQVVYMLGFAPGQPYMGDLPERLAIPRREAPVSNVPKGSVLTATGKTVIYPNSNPTGWHIIGRTPVPIFDKSSPRPALLTPGDHVHFYEVGIDKYLDLETRLHSELIDVATEFLL
ncbi:MAG: allophanate hydrolase subunit 1 [Rhizobiaceae bacterium]